MEHQDKTGVVFSKFKLKENTKDIGEDFIEIEGYANPAYNENNELIVDSDGDVVLPEAYDLKRYKQNPIILYQHNKKEPIGSTTSLEITSRGLLINAKIFKSMNEKAFVGIKNGILKTFSIGFVGKDGNYDEKSGVFYFKDIELLEISVVSVPANSEATFNIGKRPCDGLTCFSLTSNTVKKEWKDLDKKEITEKIHNLSDLSQIKEAYLVPSKNKEQCKFLHHRLENNELVLDEKGLASALSSIKGSLKDENQTKMFDLETFEHLIKHYKELDKPLNDLKEVLLLAQKQFKDSSSGIDKLLENLGFQKTKEVQETEEVEDTVEESREESNESSEEVPKITLEEATSFILESVSNTDETKIDPLIEFYGNLGDDLNSKIAELIN